MVIEQRLPSLLSLLKSHVGTTTSEIPMVPRPPMPIPPPPPQTELAEKKRKMNKKGGKGFIKEGEVQEDTLLEPTKVAKPTRAQQRKGGESLEMVSKCRSRVPS